MSNKGEIYWQSGKDSFPGQKLVGLIPRNVLQAGDWDTSSKQFFAGYNGPVTISEVIISNPAIRRKFKKDFEYVSRNLFFITTFNARAISEEALNKAIKARMDADSAIKNATDTIQLVIDQAILVLKSQNIDEPSMSSNAQTVLVPITTQSAGKYAEFIALADRLFNLNTLIFGADLIDHSNKFLNESVVRKQFQAVSQGVESQFKAILNLAKNL